MATEMEDDSHSPRADGEEPFQHMEPRITNRAKGGIRRFIRPVERQRMRPWLIDHLDKNDIPGLVWQDKQDKIFRISWKHAANQCFNMQKDTNLFERWAMHTGRHQDSDHKRWKANFRCALNSLPDVTEMKEQGVKKGNNAFKVYRFLDEKEAKAGKDGKPRKKREPPDLICQDEPGQKKFQDDFKPFTTFEAQPGSSYEIEVVDDAQGTGLPDLKQLVPGPTGVDLLLEADSKERLQPSVGGMDNLQEILAAATASLAAGSDAQALEKISIEQLSRLGEVSRMKLDIRQSDRKRRKKEVSGILNVFLCNWCEKVFPTKTDLFQHFLVVHQDKLLSGEDYGVRKSAEHSEKLQQEIEDLEKKVLGFTQEPYQKDSEEVIEDGQVVDLSSNNSMTSQDIYIEEQVLDLSVAGALARVPQPQHDVALDLSMNSPNKQKPGVKNGTPKAVQKRRRSSANEVNYNVKFGNYGLAGAPQTKRQLSLLMKRKEEEEEKQRKQAEAQHSMEDIVHAEILMSLKSASKEENETETADHEVDAENVSKSRERNTELRSKMDEDESEKALDNEDEEKKIKPEKICDIEVGKDKVLDSSENVLYTGLKDDGKPTVFKQAENAAKKLKSEIIEDEASVGKRKQVQSALDAKNEEKPTSGKPYKCALCVERFEDPTELLVHVSVHKTEYTCSVCMQVMMDKNVYLNHIESHLPDVKHKEKSTVETAVKIAIKPFSNDVNKKSGSVAGSVEKTEEKSFINEKEAASVKATEKGAASVKAAEKGAASVKATEKGAASVKATEKQSSEESRNDLNKITTNTGQKNLKGEPAVNPAAGSDNRTGEVNVTKLKKYVQKVSELESNFQKNFCEQESFELKVDCNGDLLEPSSQNKDVRNDVVDGEQREILKISVAENLDKKIHYKDLNNANKEKPLLKTAEQDSYIVEKCKELQPLLKAAKSTQVQQKDDIHGCCSVKEISIPEKNKLKGQEIKSVKQPGVKVSSKVLKCEFCSGIFATASDLNRHRTTHKEIVEDKKRKHVFHCGLCDRELAENDVQEHLMTHKSGKKETQKVELNYDCPCMICEKIVPLKQFHSHLKSHSVYELSQAQNLDLAQASSEKTVYSAEGKKPFRCNLCSVKFETFMDLKNHVNTHLGPRTVQTKSTIKTKVREDIADESRAINSDKNAQDTILILGKVRKRKSVDEKKLPGKRSKQTSPAEDKMDMEIQNSNIQIKEEIGPEEGDIKPVNVVTDVQTKTLPAVAAALNTIPNLKASDIAVGKSREDIYSGLMSRIRIPAYNTSEYTDAESEFKKSVNIEKLLKGGEVIVVKGDKILGQVKEGKRKVDNLLKPTVPKRLKFSANDQSNPLNSSGSSEVNVLHESSKSRQVKDEKKNNKCFTESKVVRNSREKVSDTEQILSHAGKKGSIHSSDKTLGNSVYNKGTNVSVLVMQNLKQKVGHSQQGPSKVNALPSTLRNLQQKLMLEQQGAHTEGTSLICQSPVPVVTSHHSVTVPTMTEKGSSFNAVLGEASSCVIPVNVAQNKTHQESCIPILTSPQQTEHASPPSTSSFKQLDASQKLLLAAANVSLATSSIDVAKSLPTSQSWTGVQILAPAGIATQSLPRIPVDSSPTLSPADNVSQLLAKISNLCKSHEITSSKERLQSSVPGVNVSQSSFTSPSKQFDSASVQKQSGEFPVGHISANSSVHLDGSLGSPVTEGCPINNTAKTASMLSTNSKSQQQLQQLNTMKLNLSNLRQPSLTSLASLTSALSPQVDTLTNINRFASPDMLIPKTGKETSTHDSKISGVQLLWLPMNQVQSAAQFTGFKQACYIVPATSATGSNSESAGSAVLKASVKKDDEEIPGINQPLHTSLSSALLSDSKAVDIKPFSAGGLLAYRPATVNIDTKASVSVNHSLSGVSALQSSVIMPTLITSSAREGLPGVSSTNVKKENNLILACGVCRQSLVTFEQMNKHACKSTSVNPGQRFVTLTRFPKTATISVPAVSSIESVTTFKPTISSLTTIPQPTRIYVLPSTKSATVSRMSASSQTHFSVNNLIGLPKVALKGTAALPTTLVPSCYPHAKHTVSKQDRTGPGESTGNGTTLAKTAVNIETGTPSTSVFQQTEDKEKNLASSVNETQPADSKTAELALISGVGEDVTETNKEHGPDLSHIPNARNKYLLSSLGQKLRAKALANISATLGISSKDKAEQNSRLCEDAEKVVGNIKADSSSSAHSFGQITRNTGIASSNSRAVQFVDENITQNQPQLMEETKTDLTCSAYAESEGSKLVQISREDVQTTQEEITDASEAKTDVKTETTEEMLKIKEENPKPVRPSKCYSCIVCFTYHDSENLLIEHYQRAHPGMAEQLGQKVLEEDRVRCALKHECRLCFQRFHTFNEYLAHLKEHFLINKLKYLVCCSCGVYFSSEKAFKCHCRSTTISRCSSATYVEKYVLCKQCHCCSVNFTSKECLKKHIKRKWYHEVYYKCSVCAKMIESSGMYISHLEKHLQDMDQDLDIRFCHTCYLIFPNKVAQMEHMALSSHLRVNEARKKRFAINNAKKNSCEYAADLGLCKQVVIFDMKNRFLPSKQKKKRTLQARQMTDADENEGAKSTVVQGLYCKQCDKCFATPFEMRQHTVIRHLNGVKSIHKKKMLPPKCYRMCRAQKKKRNTAAICKFCGKRFFHFHLLFQHIGSTHKDMLSLSGKNTDFDKKLNSVHEFETQNQESTKMEDAESTEIFEDLIQPSVENLKEYIVKGKAEDCRQLLDKMARTVELIQEHLGDHFLCQYCKTRFSSCSKLKSHLKLLHSNVLAQCVDCKEYFFQEAVLLEHRLECAVKGFSDEDFHTKKKVLGCEICLNSFIEIIGLTKHLQELRWSSEKKKLRAAKCSTRKGVLDLHSERDIEKSITYSSSRKFVCVNCKNEYCNAEDFFNCMKSRLVIERNKPKDTSGSDTGETLEEVGKVTCKLGMSPVDLLNVFFCNDCEAIVCFETGGVQMCTASLQHLCAGSETII